MKKLFCEKNRKFYIRIILFLLAGLFLFSSNKRSYESMMAIIMPAMVEGEYCQNGGEWKPYTEETDISALEGDVVFKGNFALDLSEVTEYQFYLDHIELTIFKNGQKAFCSVPDYPLTRETTCVESWSTWFCEPVKTDDVLEFHLHNPHKTGNIDAYNDFFESIYVCPEILLQGHLQQQHRTAEIVGMVIVIIAVVLLGMAAGTMVTDVELGHKLWPYGLLALFMGGYIIFDVQIGIINYYKDILPTNLQRICMMFAAYEISCIVQAEINRLRNKKLPSIVLFLGIFNAGLLALALLSDIMLYDTLQIWQIAQGVVFCVLIYAGIKTFMEISSKKWNILLSGILMMGSVLLEFVNGYIGLWSQGVLWKAVFVICLVHHLIDGISTVPKNYRASKEAERLKRELNNSRVVLAMSQIRTHFIFNVLNAISGMCLYDPAEANRTISHFAKYLRGNINVLQDDELILFKKELEHLEDYIVLEKVRFEDKIRFEKEIEEEEFLVPPMILQPVVENAIKHGLLRTKQGGCITLKTKREADNVIIQIIDNGRGFDTNEPIRDGAVGISNVKFRLEHMIGGRMDMESVPEKGTTVTITVPYVAL